MHILVFHREVVDAALRWRDPARHLAGLDHALHEREDVGAVALRWDPVREALLVLMAGDHPALRVDRHAGPRADGAAEAGGGQRQAEVVPGALDLAVPALQADLAVLEVGL